MFPKTLHHASNFFFTMNRFLGSYLSDQKRGSAWRTERKQTAFAHHVASEDPFLLPNVPKQEA